MSDDPEQTPAAFLIGDLKRRFPLFETIVGQFGDENRESIPWFFAFLLAAASAPSTGGCCFVLDMSTGTAAIAALLAALDRLKSDFPRLVEDYARYAFSPGQRVRGLPSDGV